MLYKTGFFQVISLGWCIDFPGGRAWVPKRGLP